MQDTQEHDAQDAKDFEKIRIMSKMAVYDKRGFEKDAKSNHYFRHDYIYKKNMRMRFFLGLGCLILALFYAMYLIGVDEVDIFTMDYFQLLMRVLAVGVVIMVGYSLIGTILYTREFELSQKRIGEYFKLMDNLSSLKGVQIEEEAEFEPKPKRAGSIHRKRPKESKEPEKPKPKKVQPKSAKPKRGASIATDDEKELIYNSGRYVPYRLKSSDDRDELDGMIKDEDILDVPIKKADSARKGLSKMDSLKTESIIKSEKPKDKD